ncbi:MAG: transposase [Deltaproteobacteria bacterium]|nr:transposase [Deltaproteobacteria bacterium]
MVGILDFYRRYGDEATCLAKLVEMRWPNGFQCSHCGESGFYH